MKIVKDELVYDGPFIQVIRRQFIGRLGEQGIWEVVRRKTFGRLIATAALTPEHELILVKIFRWPINNYVLELPAGIMDVEEESEIETAKRELLEETGYKTEKLRPLLNGPFNAGLLADEMAIYFGENARKVTEPKLDNAEDIEVVKVPLKNLIDYLSKENKTKIDLKVAAIIPFLIKK